MLFLYLSAGWSWFATCDTYLAFVFVAVMSISAFFRTANCFYSQVGLFATHSEQEDELHTADFATAAPLWCVAICCQEVYDEVNKLVTFGVLIAIPWDRSCGKERDNLLKLEIAVDEQMFNFPPWFRACLLLRSGRGITLCRQGRGCFLALVGMGRYIIKAYTSTLFFPLFF